MLANCLGPLQVQASNVAGRCPRNLQEVLLSFHFFQLGQIRNTSKHMYMRVRVRHVYACACVCACVLFMLVLIVVSIFLYILYNYTQSHIHVLYLDALGVAI